MQTQRCITFGTDQPAGMPTVHRNPYSVSLSADEVITMLTLTAPAHQQLGCEFVDCETCNGFRACWWDLYNALRREHKLDVAISIQAHGYRLPDGPWEVED